MILVKVMEKVFNKLVKVKREYLSWIIYRNLMKTIQSKTLHAKRFIYQVHTTVLLYQVRRYLIKNSKMAIYNTGIICNAATHSVTSGLKYIEQSA